MRTPLDTWTNSLNVRNRYVDSIFYDVGSLTQDDKNTLFPDNRGILSPFAYREGEIIVVPPSGAGKIRHYKHTLPFLNEEGQGLRAIVVAGVGSSVYGTAALARNVASTYGFDVAGIVTGYGGSDLLTEAMGGWFVLGLQERAGLRSDLIEPTPDVKILIEILLADPPHLELLVGHSKGSLLVDFVMERFVEELEGGTHPLLDRLTVRTLGAVVLPPKGLNVRQFMGELDSLGNLNSHRGVRYEEVRGAGHHLNPHPPIPLPNHLDVSAVLRSERGDFPEKPVRSTFALTRSRSSALR
jgi:hypothetical protein